MRAAGLNGSQICRVLALNTMDIDNPERLMPGADPVPRPRADPRCIRSWWVISWPGWVHADQHRRPGVLHPGGPVDRRGRLRRARLIAQVNGQVLSTATALPYAQSDSRTLRLRAGFQGEVCDGDSAVQSHCGVGLCHLLCTRIQCQSVVMSCECNELWGRRRSGGQWPAPGQWAAVVCLTRHQSVIPCRTVLRVIGQGMDRVLVPGPSSDYRKDDAR